MPTELHSAWPRKGVEGGKGGEGVEAGVEVGEVDGKLGAEEQTGKLL